MRSSQSSSYCHCRVDGDVTVMPFVGVLTQHSLLARRSLRRFIDVVIVVVAALGAFRRVPCRLSLVAFAVVKTMIRPARAASFELTKLATRVGGAANTSPLTRLVRELLFCRPRDHRPHDRRVVAIVTSSRSSRPRDRRILASPASENRLIVACVFRIARSPPSPRAIDGGRSVRPPHTCCSRRRIRALSFEPVTRSSLSRLSLQRSLLQHRVSSLRK